MSTPDQRDHVHAAISACGTGMQWQRALDLIGEMHSKGLQANVITYSAAISACEKGNQWQPALEFFEELSSQGVQADLITYNAGPELAAGRDAALRAGGERHQLQRHDQRLREGQAMRASLGFVAGDAALTAGACRD